MTDTTLSRQELLAIRPREVFKNGLRAASAVDDTGLCDRLRTLGALIMSEQMRAAGEPMAALDLCMVALDQVRERYPVWNRAARQHAASVLSIQADGYFVLGRWLADMLAAMEDGADLDAGIRFLEATRAMWQTNRILRERDGAQ